VHRPAVAARLAALTPADERRGADRAARAAVQRERLGLPLFPTTTIGSFPQTEAIRRARGRWRSGELGDAAYEDFLREEIATAIRAQEARGRGRRVERGGRAPPKGG
jgi:5-methyltetrahydropteroyltriglutamate--homocysteine methyltransferase